MAEIVTERVIFERETRRQPQHSLGARGIGSSPPRETDAGAALSAGLRLGTMYLDGSTVMWHDGRRAVWEPCCGSWIPHPGDLDELERGGFDWTGG
jgi:hypothetical protein